MYFFLKVFELLGCKIRKESSSYCIVRLECSREFQNWTQMMISCPTTPTKTCEAVELTYSKPCV